MLKKEEYRFTVQRPYTPLYMTWFCRGHSAEANYRGLLGTKFSLQHMVELDNGNIYYSDAEFIEVARLGFKATMKKGGLKIFRTELQRREKELIETAAGNDMKRFKVAYESYTPSLTAAWCQEDLVAGKALELLNEKLPLKEAEELVSHLNVPLKDNYYKQEEYDLVTTNDLNAHAHKYSWIKSRYGHIDPYTTSEAKKKKRQIDKENFLNKQQKEKEQTKRAVNQAKELLGDEARIVDVMQWLVYYRTQRTDIINKAIFLFAPTIKRFAASNDLDYEQVLYCTVDELFSILPDKLLISERQQGCSVLMYEGKIRCLSGEDNRKLTDFFQLNIKHVKEIKGNVACAGIIKGKVKLITNKEDINKVKDGDVLVTSMTTPNMLPAMQKAAAFVTDEGGITCHAAIVSREMKKPCIIGTKIATQVLKDGDMVEVDADRGVIKLLKEK